MKTKLIILVISLLSFVHVSGQGGDGGLLAKCFIDSQTGDTIRITKWTRVNYSSKYLLNFRMTRTNSFCTFDLSYHFGASEPFTIAKGDSIWLKFIGGMKLALYSKESAASVKGGAMTSRDPKGATIQGVKVKYDISQTQLLGLAGNELEKVRIFSSKGYIDILWPEPYRDDLKPEPTKTIMAARLMLEKKTKYIVTVPDSEDVKVNKEEAKKDEF